MVAEARESHSRGGGQGGGLLSRNNHGRMTAVGTWAAGRGPCRHDSLLRVDCEDGSMRGHVIMGRFGLP